MIKCVLLGAGLALCLASGAGAETRTLPNGKSFTGPDSLADCAPPKIETLGDGIRQHSFACTPKIEGLQVSATADLIYFDGAAIAPRDFLEDGMRKSGHAGRVGDARMGVQARKYATKGGAAPLLCFFADDVPNASGSASCAADVADMRVLILVVSTDARAAGKVVEMLMAASTYR